jgi:hypothetical protein
MNRRRVGLINCHRPFLKKSELYPLLPVCFLLGLNMVIKAIIHESGKKHIQSCVYVFETKIKSNRRKIYHEKQKI